MSNETSVLSCCKANKFYYIYLFKIKAKQTMLSNSPTTREKERSEEEWWLLLLVVLNWSYYRASECRAILTATLLNLKSVEHFISFTVHTNLLLQ